MATKVIECRVVGGRLDGVLVLPPTAGFSQGELLRWSGAGTRVRADECDDEVVYFQGDTYFGVDELVRELGYLPSRGVFGTVPRTLGLDPYQVAELVEDDAYEDYRMDDGAYAAIADFCRDWTERFGETVYDVDYDRAVVVPASVRPVAR